MSDKATILCEKCRKTMDVSNFYISKNTEKYPPDGRLNVCKKCLTMHVNNWEPSTYMHILQEIDIPYIPQEWEALLERYGKDPKKVTGVTILGRYLSKMKLKQFAHLNWSDTERLMEDDKKKQLIIRQQEEAQRNRYAAALQSGEVLEGLEGVDIDNLTEEQIQELFPAPEQMPTSLEDELTQEDKKYLSLKWGKLYRPEEWIALEQFYEQMTGSFDIQTAAHFDYLKMICKTSLKMNQAIDCGDIEGFAKLQKAYDSLMKSAKFTAAQNKAETGEFVDSVGELVYLCEEQGFIPRFHTDEPKDIVDITLKDMQGYAYRLVTEEMGLGNMIEAALQQMQREEEKEEGELDENDEFLNPELTPVLEDADYEDYYEELEAQQQQDEQNMNGDGE